MLRVLTVSHQSSKKPLRRGRDSSECMLAELPWGSEHDMQRATHVEWKDPRSEDKSDPPFRYLHRMHLPCIKPLPLVGWQSGQLRPTIRPVPRCSFLFQTSTVAQKVCHDMAANLGFPSANRRRREASAVKRLCVSGRPSRQRGLRGCVAPAPPHPIPCGSSLCRVDVSLDPCKKLIFRTFPLTASVAESCDRGLLRLSALSALDLAWGRRAMDAASATGGLIPSHGDFGCSMCVYSPFCHCLR